MKGLHCPGPQRTWKPVTNLSSWVAAVQIISPFGPKRTWAGASADWVSREWPVAEFGHDDAFGVGPHDANAPGRQATGPGAQFSLRQVNIMTSASISTEKFSGKPATPIAERE